MGIVTSIIIGGLVGWLASLIMKTDNQMGLLFNIIVGIIGALFASWFFGDVLNLGSAIAAGTFSFLGVIWGIIGSIFLIGTLKMLNVLR